MKTTDVPSYPEDWAINGFPDPNPYFPEVPRRTRGFGVLISLAICPGVPIAAGYLMSHSLLQGVVVVLTAVFGGYFAFMNLNARFESFKYWRKKRVVPAVIVKPSIDAALSPVFLLLPFVAGLLIRLLAKPDRNNKATVRYWLNGSAHECEIEMHHDWDKYCTGDYMWVVNTKRSEVVALTLLAPRKFLKVAVPEEVQNWLQAVMPHEKLAQLKNGHPFYIPLTQKENKLRDREVLKAAKANTKAIKIALKYGADDRP